jgi:hypothetical protein
MACYRCAGGGHADVCNENQRSLSREWEENYDMRAHDDNFRSFQPISLIISKTRWLAERVGVRDIKCVFFISLHNFCPKHFSLRSRGAETRVGIHVKCPLLGPLSTQNWNREMHFSEPSKHKSHEKPFSRSWAITYGQTDSEGKGCLTTLSVARIMER